MTVVCKNKYNQSVNQISSRNLSSVSTEAINDIIAMRTYYCNTHRQAGIDKLWLCCIYKNKHRVDCQKIDGDYLKIELQIIFSI